MREETNCIKCNRRIDGTARLCPFCNWDQSEAPPEPEAVEAPPEPIVEPTGRLGRFRSLSPAARQALLIAAAAILLIGTFAIGGAVYAIGKHGPRERSDDSTARIQTTTSAPAADRQKPGVASDLQLVPSGSSLTGAPVTSAPVAAPDQSADATLDRTDATALAADAYAKAVKSASMASASANGTQTPQAPETAAALDPRTIRTRRYDVAPKPPEPKQPAPSAAAPVKIAETHATEPVPISQPVPQLHNRGSVRFNLTIGRDGRVKRVDVLHTSPGLTPPMIAAVQRWRFRPATEDGRPVEGQFLVDVSFNGDE
ncbi:MAG: energy transducer TonB [Thermoanaerobaculia bacterium]